MYDQQYANSIGIQHIHNSLLQANKHYAFTISCVQDACLEHAETLKIITPLHFLFSKYFNYHIIPK